MENLDRHSDRASSAGPMDAVTTVPAVDAVTTVPAVDAVTTVPCRARRDGCVRHD